MPISLAEELKSYLKNHHAWWEWDNHKNYAILASGAYSDFYANCTPILCNPFLLQRVGAAMADQIRERNHGLWVFGPAYGGIALAHAVASRFPDGRAGYAEKTSEARHLRTISRFTEFFDSPPRVLFIEDVVTTLSSIRKMKEAFDIQYSDATIMDEVLCIINRSGESELHGFKIKSLIDVKARIWRPEEVGAHMPLGIYPKKNWNLLQEK